MNGKKVHLYIGHGAYRIGSDDPNWLDPDQMPNQILFNRNFNNVKGSIFFSTQSLRDNPLGFNDRLQQDLYAYPALVPEMNWLGQSKPAAPTDMTGAARASGIQLDWQDPQDEVAYYVIYRSVGDQAPDISNPANIYDEVRKISGNHQLFIDHSVEQGKTYTYTITSFNRAHQESDSTQHVTVEAKELEPIQAIEFDKIPALYTGNSHQVSIKAIYKDRTEQLAINDQMEFSSSNPGIATIDNHGLAKAIAAGKTTLTAKYQSLSAVYELTVLSSSTGGGDNPGGGTGGGGSGGGSGSTPSTPPSTKPPTDPPAEDKDNNQDPNVDGSEKPSNVTLSDISGHWAEISIQQAVQQKWINGYNDGTFRPNQPVNREQFAVMLSRALKLEGNGTDVTFADADKIAAWARPHIARVLESGIINGYQDHTFRPDQQINRAEMAAMIVRALGIEPNSKTAPPFSDANTIPAWASPYVAAAYHAGIIQGRSNQAFAPKENATRAEAVIMILRMLQYTE
ncbi:hypothetical protein GCM10008933_03180 [Paenibacillus motobuensis]|uniref:SLH domain-containing protein n=1 Tax=Paenibacillus motobuensis TaxID=295324 RepID=A0ABN0XXW1_9BACL